MPRKIYRHAEAAHTASGLTHESENVTPKTDGWRASVDGRDFWREERVARRKNSCSTCTDVDPSSASNRKWEDV